MRYSSRAHLSNHGRGEAPVLHRPAEVVRHRGAAGLAGVDLAPLVSLAAQRLPAGRRLEHAGLAPLVLLHLLGLPLVGLNHVVPLLPSDLSSDTVGEAGRRELGDGSRPE